MLDYLFVLFDWMPAGVKALFIAAVFIMLLPFFIDIILKVISLFIRR